MRTWTPPPSYSATWLVEYLNDPPEHSDLYEAVRLLAEHFAGVDVDKKRLYQAKDAVEKVATEVVSRSHFDLGPMPGRGGAPDREVYSSAGLLPSAPIQPDERAAVGLMFYVLHEQEELHGGGRGRWRIRRCDAPRCGKFFLDSSINSSRVTCSDACRMRRLRAQ